MILALILATSLFLLSVGSHLVILNAGHTLLEQNCSLLHKLGIALLVLFSHLTVAAFFAAGFWIGEELGLGGFRQAGFQNHGLSLAKHRFSEQSNNPQMNLVRPGSPVNIKSV